MLDLDFSIHQATLRDIPVILELIHLKAGFDGCPEHVIATSDDLKRDLFGEMPLASVLLAKVKTEVIGFATYHRIYSTFLAKPGLWLDDLYLKREFRGRGIGRCLMLHLCEMADQMGCGRIDWIVATNNTKGIQFYRKLGATPDETVRLCRLDQAMIVRNLQLLSKSIQMLNPHLQTWLCLMWIDAKNQP